MAIDTGSVGSEITTFSGWVVVGILGSLAVVTPFTVGPFAAVLAVAGAALLIWRRSLTVVSPAGVLSGAGLIPLYVAYLNRRGPGQVCRSAGAGSTECTDAWSPWPFLTIGVLLIAAGVVMFVLVRRRGSRGGPARAGSSSPAR